MDSGRDADIVSEPDPVGSIGASVRGDADPDGPSLDTGVRIDTELLERAGPRCFDHHIGRVEQPSQRVATARLAERERHGFVAVMEQIEERGRTTTGAIGASEALDLDHARTRQPEQVRAQWAGPERGQVDHERAWVEPELGGRQRRRGDDGVDFTESAHREAEVRSSGDERDRG